MTGKKYQMSENEQLLQNLLEEKKAELSAKERKFEVLIEKNLDMLTLVSAEGKILYASPALTQVLGFSNKEILSMNTLDFVHPDDIPVRKEVVNGILRFPGKSYYRQQQLRHKDGTWIWCEGTVTNMLHEPGINALISNFRDITEQKTAVQALEKSEERFREFFENAPEGIAIVDTERLVFTEFNTNALKLLKFSPEEMVKMGPLEISPKYQPDGSLSEEKAKSYIAEAMEGKKPVFEWLVKNGDGKLVFFEARLAALANTSPAKIYASFVDITERKTMEVKLVSHNRILAEIAAFQSHQVRKPVASLLGLISLVNFDNPSDPFNLEIILKLKSISAMFDDTIKAIILKAGEINDDLGKLF